MALSSEAVLLLKVLSRAPCVLWPSVAFLVGTCFPSSLSPSPFPCFVWRVEQSSSVSVGLAEVTTILGEARRQSPTCWPPQCLLSWELGGKDSRTIALPPGGRDLRLGSRGCCRRASVFGGTRPGAHPLRCSSSAWGSQEHPSVTTRHCGGRQGVRVSWEHMTNHEPGQTGVLPGDG